MGKFIAAALFALAATQASASGAEARPAPAGSTHVVELVIWNDEDQSTGLAQFSHSVDTPYGTILLTETRTENYLCLPYCPDEWRIVAMPAAIWAETMLVVVEENGVARIRLYLSVVS